MNKLRDLLKEFEKKTSYNTKILKNGDWVRYDGIEKIELWQYYKAFSEWLVARDKLLKDIAVNTPELNMGNYTEEQVEILNNAMIDINNILRRYE